MTRMKNTIDTFYRLLLITTFCLLANSYLAVAQNPGNSSTGKDKLKNNNYQLVWEDNFETDGHPSAQNWNYEYGFVRNRELQLYQPQNASCKNGLLIIEGKQENIDNQLFNPLSDDWRINRAIAQYTSACLITRELQEWPPFGYFEIRARINTTNGAWPAIWLLGKSQRWPHCGEIDIMEFYRINDVPHLLANAAWASEYQYQARWDDAKIPLSHFTDSDPQWADKFHIWSMYWDKEQISIFIDDELMNEIDLKNTINPDGFNPFTSNQKFYLLLNLAIGSNGGEPDQSAFPINFEVDYVRVYKPEEATN